MPPNFIVVVQLAVLNRPDASILVGERLVTALDIDDAQAPDPERDAVGRIGAAIIGPAMCHRVGHPVEDLRRDDLAGFPPQLNDSANSAHGPSNASAAAPNQRRP